MQRTIFIVAAAVTGLMLIWAVLFPQNSVPDLPSSPPPSDWFQAAVLEAPETVLVDFSATWCGPCRQLAPMLVKLEEQFAGRLKVVTVDIDEEPALAAHFRVDGVPYIYLFRDGKPVDAARGLIPSYVELAAFVEPHLPAEPIAAPVAASAPDRETETASQ